MSRKPARENRQQVLQQWLQDLCRKNKGRLTPDAVVADAKRPSSPGHPFFDWDLKKAAHKHWLDQARELITSVKVVIETSHRSVKVVAYVRDPRAANDEQGMIETVRVRDDVDYSREVLTEEFARAAAILRRAYELSDALNLRDETREIITRVDTILNRLKGADEARA